MNMAQIIILIIVFLFAVISFVIAYRHLKQKGFLLNNSYLYASKDERSKMDKKPYYRQSAVAFFGIGVMLCVIALTIITNLNFLFYIIDGIAIMLIIYAIKSSAKY
jgi:hypothetical protein